MKGINEIEETYIHREREREREREAKNRKKRCSEMVREDGVIGLKIILVPKVL